jgi:hypothetical protein
MRKEYQHVIPMARDAKWLILEQTNKQASSWELGKSRSAEGGLGKIRRLASPESALFLFHWRSSPALACSFHRAAFTPITRSHRHSDSSPTPEGSWM